MKTRTILTLSLLVGFLLSACGAETPAVQDPVDDPVPEIPTAAATATPFQPEVDSQPEVEPEAGVPSEAAPVEAAPTEAPQAVATSRGPNLEASNPSDFQRASGELQLVEFFAFW